MSEKDSRSPAPLCALSIALLLSGCIQTVYPYEMEQANKTCEAHRGINRFSWGPRGMAVYCTDGSYHYPAGERP